MGVKYAFPPWRGFRIVLANRKEKMFGKIWRDFFFSRSQAPTKRASKRRRINSSVAPSIQGLCAHHDIIISWLWTIMSATMQTWVDVTTLRWLRSLRGEGGEPSGTRQKSSHCILPSTESNAFPPPGHIYIYCDYAPHIQSISSALSGRISRFELSVMLKWWNRSETDVRMETWRLLPRTIILSAGEILSVLIILVLRLDLCWKHLRAVFTAAHAGRFF